MILDYKGVSVFYSDEGKGSAVVLLHGFLENSSMWEMFVPQLIKKNRVICIDLLGHGSTGCIGYVHTMEDMADAVRAVLKHLKIKKSTIIGHSLGGYVALAFAEKEPDALKGLCLMNSTTRADTPERIEIRNRGIEAAKGNYKTIVRLSIANLFRPKSRALFKEEIKRVKNEALKTPLQGYIAAQEGMKMRPDREALLHFSPYKKMMVIGKKDPVLNYELMLNQAEGTEIELVVFPDGHMSHIENGKDLLKKIMHFIEKK